MDYILTADITTWPQVKNRGEKPLPYEIYADCIGSLKLSFSFQGSHREYDNSYINVPMFITETLDFFNRIKSGTIQGWSIGFAPFAFGVMQHGDLLLSSRGDSSFQESVYDMSGALTIAALRERLLLDGRTYGMVALR